MLTFLKKIFSKPAPAPATPPPAAPAMAAPSAADIPAPMPKVDVANLSLSAILAKLPEDLRGLVLKAPDAAATVALPIPTIMKQLPTGAVRLSLATLHRQAPPGVFGPLPPGDKRMVDVPLAEVFRHVSAGVLKRKPDQKQLETPSAAYGLFNDRSNPMAIAAPVEEPETNGTSHSRNKGVLAPPPELARSSGYSDRKSLPAVAPSPAPAPAPVEVEPPKPAAIPAPALAVAEAKAPTMPVINGSASPAPEAVAPGSIALPLAKLAELWPESLRAEIAALDPATQVALPAAALTSGLAQGRVIFTWGEIFTHLMPPAAQPSTTDPAVELALPLKVVAPAFLNQPKGPALRKKSADVDAEIPALFGPASPQPSAGTPEPPVPPAPTPGPTPAPELPVAAQLPADPEPAPAPEPVAPGPAPAPYDAGEPLRIVSQSPVHEISVPVSSAAPAPAVAASPASAGEALGDPDKTSWTPAELVQRTVQLPGVTGAIVALQEGFTVAHALPEGVTADTIAAFLPQAFGRLSQYSGEMQLGELEEVLLSARGAQCQIFRLGIIYFAILGKAGEPLPWPQLRAVAAELAKHAQHSST